MPTYTATDVGNVRDTNEDSICEESIAGGQLLAVADGMGGHSAGDVASSIAVKSLKQMAAERIEHNHTDVQAALSEGIQRANDAVVSERSNGPEEIDMGTTLVTAYVEPSRAVIGNVGDSRAYLISQDDIEQVTTDQSLVQELIDEGQISETQAENHPQRHVLSQALGTNEHVQPDFYQIRIAKETLLLCSDGLTEELSDEAIQEIIVAANTLSDAGKELISSAKAQGGSDNISVALYRK